jgi:aspartate aminotransferase-like enzyme
MRFADLQLPTRLLAGGGPSTPDARVLRALTTPVIGQFDPDFTTIMDEVAELGRRTFLTSNLHCFAVSALASGGLEAVLNSLLEEGDGLAIGGGPGPATHIVQITRGLGLRLDPYDTLRDGSRLLVLPLVDPASGAKLAVREIAAAAHSRGMWVVVDATLGFGACELRVDDWAIDVCVAGVEYAIGAPAGMTLVTYSPAIEQALQRRRAPPRTSYLDLIQLQAYWSPERLNHHTAPTSLVYGLREALRLVEEEGLEARWDRHARIGQRLRDGLSALRLDIIGDAPFSIVHLPVFLDEERARSRLLEDFGVYVSRIAPRTWRVGLLGADALLQNVNRVLAAFKVVLAPA